MSKKVLTVICFIAFIASLASCANATAKKKESREPDILDGSGRPPAGRPRPLPPSGCQEERIGRVRR